MAIEKATGIVLYSRKQGETSKIITVYTCEFGKMSVMAKGSRGVRSKYTGALETFNYIGMVLYTKENRSLNYLSDAHTIESFSRLHRNLGKMTLASIVCEIVEKSERENQSHPPLFQLLLDTLNTLDGNERGLRNVVRAFQIQFVSIAGFEPSLDRCRQCGKETPDIQNLISLEHGSYSCRACTIPNQSDRELSDKAILMLRWLSNAPVSQSVRAAIPARLGRELDILLMEYMAYHMEELAGLKSVAYLQSLQTHLGTH